jgi:3-deoxy-D-manno-octulosonic-acid transferase
MTFLLDLLYLIGGLLASPIILFKVVTSRRWRDGLAQRAGEIPVREGRRPCLWVHCASVGETNAARTFIRLVEQEYPEWDIRVSTMTNTGQSVAHKLYGKERCFFFPLDFSPFVRRALNRIRPDAIVLIELELWPNFLRVAGKRKVPVVIINGRMREERVKGYQRLRWLFGSIYDPDIPNLFCVQNETYAERFRRAGMPVARIHVTGNMKFDTVRTTIPADEANEVREGLGLGEGERVWVAACTWPGEEEICLRVHKTLLAHAPDLRLVIAPRHIERADEVERAIRGAQYACFRRSRDSGSAGPGAVCLLDTVGELVYLYSLVEFCFIGNSLTSGGGHNMLEPAALGATPVFGPLTDNFDSEASLLLRWGGAERVSDEAGLTRALLALLTDTKLHDDRARRGRHALREERGASRRNLDLIEQVLAPVDSV